VSSNSLGVAHAETVYELQAHRRVAVVVTATGQAVSSCALYSVIVTAARQAVISCALHSVRCCENRWIEQNMEERRRGPIVVLIPECS
jgi:hypothetical protein